MGNKCCGNNTKSKKNARVANLTHGSDGNRSLIHSEKRSETDAVQPFSKYICMQNNLLTVVVE